MWIELRALSAKTGKPVFVRVEEVPAGVFGEQIPDVIPDLRTACYLDTEEAKRQQVQVQWIQWGERLLSHALVEPRLTPAQVARLGPDRSDLLHTLLLSWGISADPKTKLYRAEFLRMVRRMAKWSRKLPTEILRMPISDFWLNWTILFVENDPEEEAQDAMFSQAFGGRFGVE